MVSMWIWLKRIRWRKGYGIHSPFAFDLITRVIYEKTPYYKYSELKKNRLRLIERVKRPCLNQLKVDQLLFRLVNRMQPATSLELGTSLGLTSLYIAEAKKTTYLHTFDYLSEHNSIAEELFIDKENIVYHKGDPLSSLENVLNNLPSVEFLYLNGECYKETFETCLKKVRGDSLFVIKGIYDSPQKKDWWERIVADERTGITFDLYEVGLVFFDRRKIKQHYIVNF